MVKQVAIEFFEVVIAAMPKLWELFRTVGSRDGFLAALDSTLAVVRADTDAALAKKHRGKARSEP